MENQKRCDTYELRFYGNRVKKIRERQGYTQEAFASLLGDGYSQKTVSLIENGYKDVSLWTAVKISKILQTDINYFLEWDEENRQAMKVSSTVIREICRIDDMELLKAVVCNSLDALADKLKELKRGR